jgi:uncharacterized protein YaiI (UPF0178 family)
MDMSILDVIARAKDAAFDAAQVELNTQGEHLIPEDRPIFDAAVDAALESLNYRGAVGTLDTIAEVLDRGIPDDRKLTTVVRLINAARGNAPAGGQ